MTNKLTPDQIKDVRWAALNKIANPDGTTAIGLNTAKAMLTLIMEYQDRQGPVWLTDAAEALGAVRPDGTPLSLNWTQVLESIRDLRREKEVARPKPDQMGASWGIH